MSDALGDSYVYIFAILFIGLSATVITLIKSLRAKNRTFCAYDDSPDSNFFRQEINTLQIILFFFSLSYLLRVLYDIYYGFTKRSETYANMQIQVLAGIPFDLLPIFVVLLFHRRNLRHCKRSSKHQRTESYEYLMSHGHFSDEEGTGIGSTTEPLHSYRASLKGSTDP